MFRLQYFISGLAVILLLAVNVNPVFAQHENRKTAESCYFLSGSAPVLSRNAPGIVIAKSRPQLSAAMLYKMAIVSALRKQYAIALNIFAHIYGAGKKHEAAPNTVNLTGEHPHGPSIIFHDFAAVTDTTDTDLTSPENVQPVSNAFLAFDWDSLLTACRESDTRAENTAPSRPVKIKKLLHAFDDHKKASAYGLFLHVKQPVPGKRKPFKWFGTVGHSFITLIKYNQDGSLVSRTFGFYPKKHFLLQATPILPWAASDYKNDSLHAWDESLGTLITESAFHKIIRTTKRFARRPYHLSHINCTDFALDIASIAGIHIDATKGYWPMGSGNDPGDTGQSILEKRYHTDSNNLLFVCLPALTTPSLSQNPGN